MRRQRGASSVECNKLMLFTSLHDELHWIILHNPVRRPIFRAQQKFMQKVIFLVSRFLLESPSINLRNTKDATQASKSLIYVTEMPSSGLMLPEYNRTETVGTTPNKHVSTLTHWATWRQILLLQVSLPSLAFRWDCTEKEEEGRKKMSAASLDAQTEERGMKYACFVPPVWKQRLLRRRINNPPCFVLFVDVLHEDSVFQRQQWSLMWRGMAVLFPLQSQCSVAALPVVVTHRCFPSPFCLHRQANALSWFHRDVHGYVRCKHVGNLRDFSPAQHEKKKKWLCPILGYQVPKVKHESMLNLQQEALLIAELFWIGTGLLHVQEILNGQ